MSDQIREQVSAFLDGELPESETDLLLKRLTRDSELRERFGRYSVIGEALRGSSRCAVTRSFAARVSRSIDPEPAVAMASAPLMSSRTWWRPLTGAVLAAGVAAIAVIALERRADLPPTVVANQPVHGVAVKAASPQPPEALSYTVPAANLDSPVLSPARLTNYVFAHSKYSSPLGQRNMLSGLIAEEAVPTPQTDPRRAQPPVASGSP